MEAESHAGVIYQHGGNGKEFDSET